MTQKEKVNEACKNSEQPLDNHFVDFHEMVPIGKRQNEKWISELLECDDCCYTYRSIHPKGLYELECSNCGNLAKHNKIYHTNQNDTKEKPLEYSKKLINYQTLALEDVCNGYYANAQWESKEEEERTKNTFKSAYRLALIHLEGKMKELRKM